MKGSEVTCASLYGKYAETTYALLRIVVGVLFLFHGLSKFGVFSQMTIGGFAGMVGGQVWLAVIVALVETIGGLFLILGVFSRYSATLIALVMVGAWFIVHIKSGWNPFANGGELPLVFFFVMLSIAARGPGKWSLDKKWFE